MSTTMPASMAGRYAIDRMLFQCFIVFFPCLNAFSPAVWMPLPNFFALLTMFYYAANGRLWSTFYFERDDAFLAVVFLLGLIAIFTHVEFAGIKNLNYCIWYGLTFTLPIAWVRGWLRLSKITPEQIGAAATIGLLLASGAVIVEFVMINTTHTYLADVLPYASDKLTNANVLTDFWRPRGLSAEPGFTAMVIECLAPLSWLYLRDRRFILYLVAPIAALGFLLCFSAAGFISVTIAGFIISIRKGMLNRNSIIFGTVVIFIAIVVSMSSDLSWLFYQIVGRKLLNIAGDPSSRNVSERYSDLQMAIAAAGRYPFGIGWGMIAQMYDVHSHFPSLPTLRSRGVVSLYLDVLVSAGIPALIVFASYIGRKIFRLAQRRDADSTIVLFALIAVAVHHAAVLEFWYPMLWFLIALADYLSDSIRFERAAIVQSVGYTRPY